MDKEKLNWRSFADAQGPDNSFGGPICNRWNLQGTPTLFVLDHKGVIRYRWLGAPDTKVIDEALDKLMKEAKEDSK